MPSLQCLLRHRRRLIVIIARLGYTAKGLVYLLIGVLAALGAAGLGGDNVGTKEALAHLARQPFGTLMLGALVLGLYAYAAWRGLQGLFDVEHRGRSWKALGTRLALVISGGIYASLGWYGVELLDDPQETTGGAEERTAMLMSHPGGVWLVAIRSSCSAARTPITSSPRRPWNRPLRRRPSGWCSTRRPTLPARRTPRMSCVRLPMFC